MFQTLNLSSPPTSLQFHSIPHRHSSLSFSIRAFQSEHPLITPTSFYDVLRVKSDASITEIKIAYRSLAKIHHPDSEDGSDGRDFIAVHKAYTTLSDPASRAAYDVSVVGRRRLGFYQTRSWETDQCW